MAVANNSTGSASAGTTAVPVSSITAAPTISTTAFTFSRIFVVAVAWETKSGDPARTISSITLNGDPLEVLTTGITEVGTAGGLTAASALCYWLGATTGGTPSLVCTMSGVVDHIEMAWSTMSDVRMQAPEATASAQGNTLTTFLETAITPLTAGGMLLTAFAPNNETTHTASGGQSSVVSIVNADAGTGQRLSFGAQTNVSVAAKTPRWTLTSGNFNRAAMVSAVFAPAFPVKIGDPYISGSLQIGQTLTCHPGRWQYAVQGVSTYAYAWAKNGVANGTTTQTYVTVAGDVGAAITCVVTPTNGAGAGAAATSSAVTPIAATTDKIVSTDFAAGRVFQRVGTTATVQFSGTYAGTAPTAVQVQVLNRVTDAVVVDWTTLTGSAPSAGTWTGTLASIPQGGWYYHKVRGTGAATPTGQGGNPWGVGKLVAKAGSSTFDRYGSDPTAETPNTLASQYNVFGAAAWSLVAGAGDIAHTNAVLALEPGVPIGMLQYANGGTRLHNGATGGWDSTSFADYVTLCTGVNGLKATTAQTYCLVEYMLMHVGSNDAQNATIVDQATHQTQYRSMLTNFRATTGATTSLGQATLKVFIGGGQRKPGAGFTDLQFTMERSAELTVGDDSNCYYIPGMTDLEIAHDATHYRPLQFAEHARRAARAVGNAFGLTALPYKGPKPASAVYNGTNKVTVTFTFTAGTALVTEDGVTTGLTGFLVATDTAFTSLVTLTGAVIGSNPQTVELSFGGTPAAPLYVSYATGANPTSTRRLFDNSGSPP